MTLSLIIFSPIIYFAAIIVFSFLTIRVFNKKYIYFLYLLGQLITLFLTFFLVFQFDFSYSGYQFIEDKTDFLSGFGYRVGVDILSLILICVSNTIFFVSFIYSYYSIHKRNFLFLFLFSLLQTVTLGSFLALDLILFFIFFEFMLVPIFIFIGIWGSGDVREASYRFFLYTFFGSLSLLLGIVYITCFGRVGISSEIYYPFFTVSDFRFIKNINFSSHDENILFLLFSFPFLVKSASFPFHRWLPFAHVSAPFPISIILSSILLKLGSYGFLRFSLFFFPNASVVFADFMVILGIISIFYGAFLCLRADNIKEIIAYSSVSHMGFILIGFFVQNYDALMGSIFQIVSHAFISAGLFLLVGCLYERFKFKDISKYGGLASAMPLMSFFFIFFVFSNLALPGTSGFISEMLVFFGLFDYKEYLFFSSFFCVIFSAAYNLRLYKGIFLEGIPYNIQISSSSISDININEMVCLLILLFPVIVLGVFPHLFTYLIDIWLYDFLMIK